MQGSIAARQLLEAEMEEAARELEALEVIFVDFFF